MAFKSSFIYQAPDADPDVHRATIKTDRLELTIVVIRMQNFDQAVDVCKSLVKDQGVQNIVLCPGFPDEAVVQVKKAVGDKVSVAVARSDTPNQMLVVDTLTREGWFPAKH